MPDIRNFFGAKGGAPPKQVASKTDDTAKTSRASMSFEALKRNCANSNVREECRCGQ